MSRRARRRGVASDKPAKKPWLAWFLCALFGILVVISLGSYIWLRSYLASENFRHQLIRSSNQALHANTTLSPLRWDGFRLSADEYLAEGEEFVKKIHITGLKTGVEPSAIFQGTWDIVPSRIAQLTASLDNTIEKSKDEDVSNKKTSSKKSSKWYDSFLPKKYQLSASVIENGNVEVLTKSGLLGMHNSRWETEAASMQQQLRLKITNGTVITPWKSFPPLALQEANMSLSPEMVYVRDSNFSVYKNGQLSLSGEYNLPEKICNLQGNISNVLCAEILPETWRHRLSGTVSSEFLTKIDRGNPHVTGHLKITNGVLTALPVLDKLAAYSQSIRFRTLSLKDAETDYEIKGENIIVKNLKLGSEGLAQLEGKITLTKIPNKKHYALNGDFMLGLAPGTLSSIPGAETVVFASENRGLRWTTLHISGTTDDIEEDLSDRLIQAAGLRMFDIIPATGEKVLKFTKDVVDEKTLKKATEVIDDASKILEKNQDIIKDATKVLDVFLK